MYQLQPQIILDLVALYPLQVVTESYHEQENLICIKESGYISFGWFVDLQPMCNFGREQPAKDRYADKYKGVTPYVQEERH